MIFTTTHICVSDNEKFSIRSSGDNYYVKLGHMPQEVCISGTYNELRRLLYAVNDKLAEAHEIDRDEIFAAEDYA